ncbi:TetR/AcrR family transcriptional regulator [Catenulispora yoronensis]|uniref:TetR/AcrR family transcriptional regulator n=2 Tax=Catenulispora yoronensis TaxID=450799 RepID=A0ABP5F5J9_9ACTN
MTVMTATAPELQGNPRKRRAILDAAATVFLREGFTRASVDAIAADANVSKQTVYNHFGDKNGLFMAVTDAVQDEAVLRIMDLMDTGFPDPATLTGPGDLRAALLRLTGEWTRAVYTGRLVDLRKLVDSEAEHHPELRERWFANGPGRTYPRLNRLLTELARAGLLDVPDAVLAEPDLLAHQLTAVTGTDVRQIRPEMDFEAEFDRRVARGVDFFLRAYEPR